MYALMLQLTAVLWLVTQTQAADIVGGADRAEHAALCKFITMASSSVEVPEIPALATDEYDYIHMVNFSTAPESWQNMFFENKAAKKAHESPAAANVGGRGFENNWDQWKKTALAQLKADTPAVKKQAGVAQLTMDEAALAKPHLSHLAELADGLIAELKALQNGKDNPTETAVKQALAQAAYGDTAPPVGDPDSAKAFGAPPGTGNREAICEAKPTWPQAASAVAAIACVCNKGNAQAVSPAACTSQADGTTAWQEGTGTATATAAASLGAIIKSCPQPGQRVTAAQIRTAITDLGKLIHKGATDAYIGSFVTTGCTGSSGNGVCVKFSGWNGKQKPLVNELTWIRPLTDLLKKLEHLETKQRPADQLVEQMKRLKKDTTVVIETARATASTMAKFDTKTNHQKPKSETTSNCSTHNTNETCTTNKCK